MFNASLDFTTLYMENDILSPEGVLHKFPYHLCQRLEK